MKIDEIAALAMQTLISKYPDASCECIAEQSYKYAQAMIDQSVLVKYENIKHSSKSDEFLPDKQLFDFCKTSEGKSMTAGEIYLAITGKKANQGDATRVALQLNMAGYKSRRSNGRTVFRF
jgi:hypothetical protein